jgi:hypothetical protein
LIVCLQVYIAEEESKFGLDEQELDEILKQVQNDKENLKTSNRRFNGNGNVHRKPKPNRKRIQTFENDF